MKKMTNTRVNKYILKKNKKHTQHQDNNQTRKTKEKKYLNNIGFCIKSVDTNV